MGVARLRKLTMKNKVKYVNVYDSKFVGFTWGNREVAKAARESCGDKATVLLVVKLKSGEKNDNQG